MDTVFLIRVSTVQHVIRPKSTSGTCQRIQPHFGLYGMALLRGSLLLSLLVNSIRGFGTGVGHGNLDTKPNIVLIRKAALTAAAEIC